MRFLLTSFAHFTNLRNPLPFIEMTRRTMKKEKKLGARAPDTFKILRAVQSITEINNLITCGQWTQAAILLMNLSCAKLEVDNEAVFNAMNVQWRTRILEYAAVIIFMLKFGVAYLPDYCLSYIDYKTDFEPYYGDEQDINLKRQKSSLMRQNSMGRANSL